MKNKPKNIIVHHTAVKTFPGNKQYEAVRKYHLGKGWGDGTGYHYFIEENGGLVHGRDDLTPGAHTKEKAMNYNSIGICLAGHFDLQDPTEDQCEALYGLIRSLQNQYNIPAKNIFPHREFATYKSCWGSRLPNDIMGYLEHRLSNIVEPVEIAPWAEEAVKIATEKKIIEDWSQPGKLVDPNTLWHVCNKLGFVGKRENEGGLTLEQLAVFLHRSHLI